MKKYILLITIGFLLNLSIANGFSDEQCYQETLQYEYTSEGEVCYTNYYYNNRFYKLYMPCTRQAFIRLEYDVATGQLDKNNYGFKLVFLNQLLIKKGLESLYY